MKPARAGERLDTGEVDIVAAFAAKTGLQQFVAPFRVPQRGPDRVTEASSRGVAAWRKSANDC